MGSLKQQRALARGGIHINTRTTEDSWPIPARLGLLLCLISTSVLWVALAGCGGTGTDGGAEVHEVVTESGPLRGITKGQVDEYLASRTPRRRLETFDGCRPSLTADGLEPFRRPNSATYARRRAALR